MDILILGGTRFLGRSLVEAALAGGHRVTLFHRGQTGGDLYPEVEHVHGDRNDGLAPLAGRRFEVAIDTSGYVPRVVRASAEALRDSVERYAFISSISVYAEGMPAGYAEDSALATLAGPDTEEITGASYGPLKAACERVVDEVFAGRSLNARLGLLVGPHDYTDRFPYWARRLERGGDVLAPGDGTQPLQFIDVRDAAEWTLRAVLAGAGGAFNVTGPAEPLTLGRFLDAGRAALGSAAEFTWVDSAFLLENGVVPWAEIPLWLPDGANFLSADCRRALGAGLTFRPLATTLRDTAAWDHGRAVADRKSGSVVATTTSLTAERESELLRLWRARV